MLESETTKLIVYSNCETKLNIVLWRMSPDEEIIKTTEAWEFIFDHKDSSYQWFELQWIHMVESLYWKSVWSSHQIYDFQDLVFVPGF